MKKKSTKEVVKLVFCNGTIELGDVFYSSWGYDQTNINFYQVVSIHGRKTVTVREIRSNVVSCESSLSGKVKPILNDFISEPLTRRIKECGNVPLISIDNCENAYKTCRHSEKRFSQWS